MKELADFEPTEEQFGIFWKYIQDENVTDVEDIIKQRRSRMRSFWCNLPIWLQTV